MGGGACYLGLGLSVKLVVGGVGLQIEPHSQKFNPIHTGSESPPPLHKVRSPSPLPAVVSASLSCSCECLSARPRSHPITHTLPVSKLTQLTLFRRLIYSPDLRAHLLFTFCRCPPLPDFLFLFFPLSDACFKLGALRVPFLSDVKIHVSAHVTGRCVAESTRRHLKRTKTQRDAHTVLQA